MIICAAVRSLDDPRITIGCTRHGNGIEVAFHLGIGLAHLEQGFLNSQGSFLNRKEAYGEALRCGQLSATTISTKEDHLEHELYSEDLY